MNAKVEDTKPDTVTVTIDGRDIEASKGTTIIKVADDHGFHIPRFCYHRKLSAPANCRMCLVDVEMGGKPAPKPLPACATVINDGMVVRTQSERALKAQRGVMEFLLINHPLDCPICDQGGECELQDLAIGYGRGVSRFTERKRVVKDENLGPLISTDMTRCIHCTRCVRFLEEVAGNKELGGMFRGEHTEIGTFVGAGVHSELSGNIIDVCPVGALTSKPYRFRARAWEMLSHHSVAPHDTLGSNLYVHQVRGAVKRVVPRDNDSVNECWISDRDRFSYQGIYSEDRLLRPRVKENGQWRETDWETALEKAVGGIQSLVAKHGAGQLGALVSPSATLEEQYLLGRLVRGLGSDNIDHRLRQGDFRDDTVAPAYPHLGLPVAEVERLNAALVIGGYPRHDVPMLNHRLRKAARAGGDVMFVNPKAMDWNFDVAAELVTPPQALPNELATIIHALAAEKGVAVPENLQAYGDAEPGEAHRRVARALVQGERSAVVLGHLVESHPAGAELRALGALIAELSGSTCGLLTSGANGAGGWLAGAVPGRRAGGGNAEGLNARAMLEQGLRGYLLFNAEPEYDFWDPSAARGALDHAELVVVLSPYATEAMGEYADVILPVGAFTETAGTFVNAEGRWQTFSGVAKPLGESRPAWRLLRVLGNLLDLEGFEYNAPDEVHAEIRQAVGDVDQPELPKWGATALEPSAAPELMRVGTTAIYGVDPLVRRAPALQQTTQAADVNARVAPETAEKLGIEDGAAIILRQGENRAQVTVTVDEDVAPATVWLPSAQEATAALGPAAGEVTVERN